MRLPHVIRLFDPLLKGRSPTRPQAFSILLLAILWQAYTTRCHRKKSHVAVKVYTLVTVHLVLTLTATAMVWLSFIILVSICAAAHQDRGIDSVKSMEEGGVRVSIGPSPWILLTGCIVSCFWVWETLRWRHAEYVK